METTIPQENKERTITRNVAKLVKCRLHATNGGTDILAGGEHSRVNCQPSRAFLLGGMENILCEST